MQFKNKTLWQLILLRSRRPLLSSISQRSMLKPLSHTNYHLNSYIINRNNTFENNISKQDGRRVAFSEEDIPPSRCKLIKRWMAKARQQANRKDNWRKQRTPQSMEKMSVISVIGSSCTWRDVELEYFNVKLIRDVDVRQVIPEKFFNFDHLEDYNNCISSHDGADVRQSGTLCSIRDWYNE